MNQGGTYVLLIFSVMLNVALILHMKGYSDDVVGMSAMPVIAVMIGLDAWLKRRG